MTAPLTAAELAAIGRQPHKDDVHTLLDEINRLSTERDEIKAMFDRCFDAYEARLRERDAAAAEVERVTAERDEARAEVARLHNELAMEQQVNYDAATARLYLQIERIEKREMAILEKGAAAETERDQSRADLAHARARIAEMVEERDWLQAAVRALGGSPAGMLAYLRAHHIYFDIDALWPTDHWRERIVEAALARVPAQGTT